MTKDIRINLSSRDISEIVKLQNKLLQQVSIITLSRDELSIIDANNKVIGLGNRQFSNVIKTINRFGIRDDSGNFYKVLNDVIGRITLNNPIFRSYDSIIMLLFNKLLEKWTNKDSKFTQEELEVFFLQPFKFITTTDIYSSGLFINSLIFKITEIHNGLKSEDAGDFLQNGIGRRLFMLKENVDAIAKIYKCHRIDGLSHKEDVILDQNINAFYANIYAIMDCMAFVITFEDKDCDISRNEQKDLNKIGFYNKHFPSVYKRYSQLESNLNLRKLKPWFLEICDLRHPVAHRIPLYFPNIYNSHESAIYKKSMGKYNSACRDIYANGNITPQELEVKSTELQKVKDIELYEINLFCGCFLHSDKESKRYYHLSRLVIDLGILCYLLHAGLKHVEDEFTIPK